MDIIISNKKFPASSSPCTHRTCSLWWRGGCGAITYSWCRGGAGAGCQTLHSIPFCFLCYTGLMSSPDHITSPLHRAVTLPLAPPLLWPGWEHCTCTLFILSSAGVQANFDFISLEVDTLIRILTKI